MGGVCIGAKCEMGTVLGYVVMGWGCWDMVNMGMLRSGWCWPCVDRKGLILGDAGLVLV